LRQRYHRTSESLKVHAKRLRPLDLGDRCYIQNQCGNYPNRWDRSGKVVDILDHDSYLVKVDGSGRLTKRNRQFLRQFTPPTLVIDASRQEKRPTPIIAPPTAVPSSPPPNHSSPPGINHGIVTTPTTPTQGSTESPASSSLPSVPPDVPSTTPDVPLIQCDTPSTERNTSSTHMFYPIELSRPRRAPKAPKKYEPETGHWV